jgi:alpha-amylase
MKTWLTIPMMLLAIATANARMVKFSVDMTGQVVNATGVHVSGDFQEAAGYPGGNWQPNTTAMANEPGTDIYSVVVDIPAFAKYEYKFINGDQWYEVEFVPVESRVGYDFNDNRWVYIDSLYNDMALISPVLFSGNAPRGTYLLRLLVDMQKEPTVNAAGVHVAGDFQGWDPAGSILYCFADKVYENIFYVDAAFGTASYRFINGNTEPDYETVPDECAMAGARLVSVPKDTMLPVVCYSECVACGALEIIPHGLHQGAALYPNPCMEMTRLEFNDEALVHKVTLTDMLGNVIRRFPDCQSNVLVINGADLSKGIYFVRVEDGRTWLNTIKLVISK